MKRIMIGTALFMVAISLMVAVPVFAGRGQGPGKMGQGYGCGQMLNDLNLTAEQKTKLQAERTRFWNETAEIRTKIDQKETEMQNELNKTEINREALMEIQSQVSALQTDFNKLKVDHLINIRAISPELAQKCAGFFGNCGGGRMAGCMGKGGRGMGNGMGAGMMNCPAATQNQNQTQTQNAE